MNYVIFDFEWNNAYDYKARKGMNEIIEIGAVKLNSDFIIQDTFKQLVKPKISRKLSGRVKELTNISIAEIKEQGIDFELAIHDFSRWAGSDDTVFMSWSNSDLYVLVSNFSRFFQTTNISFIKKYMDAQKYCQYFLNVPKGSQISLANCAEILALDINEEQLHRALEDCYVTAGCMKKLFDKTIIKQFISECDADFFGRLAFKPFCLDSPVSEYYNVYKEQIFCPICLKQTRIVSDVECVNKSFKMVCSCDNCNKKFWAFVRAKKTYDEVVVSKRVVPLGKYRKYTEKRQFLNITLFIWKYNV